MPPKSLSGGESTSLKRSLVSKVATGLSRSQGRSLGLCVNPESCHVSGEWLLVPCEEDEGVVCMAAALPAFYLWRRYLRVKRAFKGNCRSLGVGSQAGPSPGSFSYPPPGPSLRCTGLCPHWSLLFRLRRGGQGQALPSAVAPPTPPFWARS